MQRDVDGGDIAGPGGGLTPQRCVRALQPLPRGPVLRARVDIRSLKVPLRTAGAAVAPQPVLPCRGRVQTVQGLDLSRRHDALTPDRPGRQQHSQHVHSCRGHSAGTAG